jgi:hypothetical protein
LAPCDFFPFPKLKFKLKGCQFDTIEEIQKKKKKVLDTLTEKEKQKKKKKMEETVGLVSTCRRELLRG